MLVIFIAILCGCATYSYWEAKSLVRQRSYRSAIEKFLAAERLSPNDYRIKRDLGIVYYELKNYAPAITKLREANTLNPNDGMTILYLGLSYEAQRSFDKALDAYKRITHLNKFSSIRKRIQDRMNALMKLKITADLRKAIEDEQKLMVQDIPENSIAILYFKNINQWQKLNPLEKGLAVMLTTDLSKVRKLKIVERQKLQQLMQELKLSQSELFDVQSAPRLGRLLGAKKLVKGGFITSEEGYLQIIAAVVESELGSRASMEASADGRLSDFFKIEKKLVLQLINEMGIRLSFSEIEEIKKVPTESFMAFLAFAEGLDYEDTGDLVRARNAYKRAVKLDPGFQMANEKLLEMQIAPVSSERLIQIVREIDAISPLDRLEVSALEVGSSFLPVNQDDKVTVRPTLSGKKGTLVVKGTLPKSESK